MSVASRIAVSDLVASGTCFAGSGQTGLDRIHAVLNSTYVDFRKFHNFKLTKFEKIVKFLVKIIFFCFSKLTSFGNLKTNKDPCQDLDPGKKVPDPHTGCPRRRTTLVQYLWCVLNYKQNRTIELGTFPVEGLQREPIVQGGKGQLPPTTIPLTKV